MHKSKKSSKRVAESEFQPVQNSILLYHVPSGYYYHPELQAYTDEQGQPIVQWDESETPRTEGVDDTAHAETYAEGDPGIEGNYTHSAATQEAGFQQDVDEEGLVAGVEGLAFDDDGEVDPPPQQDARSVGGSSSKGKAKEKTKTKEKGKTSGDKKSKGKGKGKEKEPVYQDAPPDEPFFNPEQHQQAQKQQHHAHRQHDQRAPRTKRGHGHKSAPPGVTGGADPNGPQPVDPAHGARFADGTDTGAPYYPQHEQAMGGPYQEGEEVQEQMELPQEFGDVGIPADAAFASGLASQEDDEDNIALQMAMQASRQGAFNDPGGFNPHPQEHNEGEPSYAQEDYEELEDDAGEGSRTPTQGNPGADPDFIRGTLGNHEPIDPRYRIEQSSKFQPGQVFKILWAEPEGQSRDFPSRVDLNTYTEKMNIQNDWGEKFYVGFRRFIIIANDEGHCQCIPILTYIRQGCKKKGVKPNKHGIVHEYGSKPRPLEGEPKLGFKPVRMEIRAAGERLARESRINYSKLVTVEHNVKVFFIGNIYWEDFNNIIPDAVDKCWQEKIRAMTRKGMGNPANPRT